MPITLIGKGRTTELSEVTGCLAIERSDLIQFAALRFVQHLNAHSVCQVDGMMTGPVFIDRFLPLAVIAEVS